MFPLGLTLIVLRLVVLPVVVLLFASFRPADQLLFIEHTRTTSAYAEVVISASTYHLREEPLSLLAIRTTAKSLCWW